MSDTHIPQPVKKRFLTPWTVVLILLMLHGILWAMIRFFKGIGSITNLDNQWPWGIWISIDVATGVALAAGGFTTSALVYIFHREHYHAVVRPALLTAMLGYTFVALGLLVDLGKYYNIWHPILPMMWHGDSVLFEVGMCVMFYLIVLYIEFLPIVVEHFKGRMNLPGKLARLNALSEKILNLADKTLNKVMFFFIIMGVLLSCLHQSSLGALMLIAYHKMHPLWYTPILPLMFLCSAILVGYSMVIFESLISSRSFDQKPEMNILTPLARIIPIIGVIYITMKITDMAIRGSQVYLLDGSVESMMFIIELGLCVIVPVLMLFFEKVRKSPKLLFAAVSMIIVGILINRINVFLVAYTPLYSTKTYFPSFAEVAITTGLVSALILVYRGIAIYFPVISQHQPVATE